MYLRLKQDFKASYNVILQYIQSPLFIHAKIISKNAGSHKAHSKPSWSTATKGWRLPFFTRRKTATPPTTAPMKKPKRMP